MATDLPLLYVRVRPQEDAAAAEYRSFLTATRLKEVDLDHLDLVRNPLPDDVFDRYSGFLIGGSPFNITDPDSTKNESQRRLEADLERIAARAADARTAALFTCYGIGVVTRMLGGTVSRAWPEDTGPVAVALTREGQSDPLLGGLATRFTALTAHKEGAAEAPPGAVLLATNEACPVQAYRSGDTLYATQFHPEPTTRDFTERMAIYRNDGYFEADAYDTIAGRVLAASVTEPARLLRTFARMFGPAAG
ncbi:glutamine amidotransferase-related protein [Microbacterium sp. DT81.1]|uniref:glutamine amidotransferase-related protein n=1 Tax=Microbacterium sp. DT81.1 TaxID=3393413 RepID=UPI003CEEF7CB